MNDSTYQQPYVGTDAQRTRLRTIIAAIDGAMARLPTPVTSDDGSTSNDGALAAWNELVALLALGPEPETRQCPVCGQIIRRAATRCRSCWSKLSPLDDLLASPEK